MKFRTDTPVIYLSGFFSQVKEGPNGKRMTLDQVVDYWRRKSKAKYRCFSFPYVGDDGFYNTGRMEEVYQNSVKMGDGILMDSGAHSFHNFVKAETGKISSKKKQKMTDVGKLREQTVEAYIKFIHKDGKKWDFAVNFDYTHDAKVCFDMWKRIKDEGCDTVPVFHGEKGSIKYFHEYCASGAKLIGLGTGGINDRRSWDKKRVYFDILFNLAEKNGVKLHGFAITHLSLMFMYPWYSVDSATWAKCSAYGKLIVPNLERNTLSMVHVSDHALNSRSSDTSYNRLPKHMRKEFERMVEEYGFDFEKLRSNLIERYCFNASIYAQHVHELKDIVEGTRARWKSLLV